VYICELGNGIDTWIDLFSALGNISSLYYMVVREIKHTTIIFIELKILEKDYNKIKYKLSLCKY